MAPAGASNLSGISVASAADRHGFQQFLPAAMARETLRAWAQSHRPPLVTSAMDLPTVNFLPLPPPAWKVHEEPLRMNKVVLLPA